jgi:hypothetical protein
MYTFTKCGLQHTQILRMHAWATGSTTLRVGPVSRVRQANIRFVIQREIQASALSVVHLGAAVADGKLFMVSGPERSGGDRLVGP